jgi:small-conductance mechanosensitive channel
MNTLRDFLPSDWTTLIVPAIVFVVAFAVGMLIRKIALGVLDRWARRTNGRGAGALRDSFRGPSILWAFIFAVHSATKSVALPAEPFIEKVLLVIWVVSLTAAGANLASRVVRMYGGDLPAPLPVTSLTQNIARMSVVAVGTLVLLNIFGLSIAPMLTALGVGGLAVALALQDTLANFFAGFYLSIANQVRVGDYIRLNSGEEGYVTDITWRSTTVRALANNLIIIPNAKLAQANITNFHLPETRMGLSVNVSVSYSCDPDHVESVLLEEAVRAAAEVPGMLAEPAPSVRLIPGFGQSSLDFSLNYQVSEFVDQYLAQHELRKRILKRFRAEGIEIPYPARTVFLARNGGGESDPPSV